MARALGFDRLPGLGAACRRMPDHVANRFAFQHPTTSLRCLDQHCKQALDLASNLQEKVLGDMVHDMVRVIRHFAQELRKQAEVEGVVEALLLPETQLVRPKIPEPIARSQRCHDRQHLK